jgi:cytoskeleton protein RodZ
MSELGDRLRQAREGQGLSLAQAAADTRILQQSLVALEEGAFQRLPSDVVTRGFIRNYAGYLGLPADELVEVYRRERGVSEKIRIVPATTSPTRRAYVFPSFFGIFFVTIALVGLAYVALNAIGRIGDANVAVGPEPTATIPPPSPLPTARPAAPAPSVPTSAIAGGAATPLPITAPAAATSEATPTPAAPIVLEVRIPAARGNEESWLRIQADGNTVFEGIMRAGQTQLFEAQRRVLIRAGNPPDVQVMVNGLQQGALGQNAGQPVNWSWPPE